MNSPQILRLAQVMARTGMGRSFIYREINARPPRFPAPVKIGRASRWNAAEVDAWVTAHIAGVGPFSPKARRK